MSPPSSGSRIGPSLRLKGSLSSEEDLDFGGHFEGEIALPQNELVIAEDAIVKANIRAAKVVLRGTVEGNVHGLERVELTGTAELTGELETREIQVQQGAVFRGRVNIITDSG